MAKTSQTTIEVAFTPDELDAVIAELKGARSRWDRWTYMTDHGEAVKAVLAMLEYQRLMARLHAVKNGDR